MARILVCLIVAASIAMGIACVSTRSAPATRPSDVVCRIALVSDPHVSIDPRYVAYTENFQKVIAEVNDARVDAVLIAGDLAQSAQPASFQKFVTMAGQFKAKTRFVAGNHDVGDKPLPTKPPTVTESRMAQFEKSVGPAHFSEEIAPGVRVVGIASSLFDSGIPAEATQWEFLERELARPRQGATLLLTHYPPFVTALDEPNEYFNINAAARPRLLELLKRGGVTAIFSGHLHRPVDLNWEGIPIIGAPAVSFGLPEGQQQVGWRLVTLHAGNRISSEIHYLDRPATTHPAAPTSRPASSPTEQLLHSDISDRVHIFYYDWYGAPPLQRSYRHWVQGAHVP